jgi:hypothetical protein
VASQLDGIDVREDEERLVLSSADLRLLERALESLRGEGAEDVTDPVQDGSLWKASVQHPALACTVEKRGAMITVTGPRLELVRSKTINFLMAGAMLVGDPEQVDGQWTIRLEDLSGADTRE